MEPTERFFDYIDPAELGDHFRLFMEKVPPETRAAQQILEAAAARGQLSAYPVVSQGVDCTKAAIWSRVRILARRFLVIDTGEDIVLYEVLRELVYPDDGEMRETIVRRVFTDPAEAAALYRSYLDDERYGVEGASVLADLGAQAGA